MSRHGPSDPRPEADLQHAAAADTEVHRVSSDLHDGPVQDIAAASIYLSLIEGRIAETGGDPEIARMARRAGEILVRATADLRRILDEMLAPDDDVDTAGFQSEIEALADDVALQTGAEVTAVFDFGGHETFRADLLPTMYRVTAEAFRNAAKHAEAAHLSIDVRVVSGSLVTAIVDDGCGFDPTADRAPGHVGLSLMERRCRAAGGSVDVASKPGEGTAVSIRLPLVL